MFSKGKADGRPKDEEEGSDKGPTRSCNAGCVPEEEDMVRGYIFGDILGGVEHWDGFSNNENALVNFLSWDILIFFKTYWSTFVKKLLIKRQT